VQPGDYVVFATGTAGRSQVVALSRLTMASGGDERITLDLVKAHGIRGAVTHRNASVRHGGGRSLPRTRVRLVPVDGPLAGLRAFDARTAPDGSFEFRGLPVGRYDLKVGASDRSADDLGDIAVLSVHVDGGELLGQQFALASVADANVTVEIGDGASLHGQLLTPDGTGRSDLYIAAIRCDLPVEPRVPLVDRPFRDGRFEFEGLEPGVYCVAAISEYVQGQAWSAEALQGLVEGRERIVVDAGSTTYVTVESARSGR
jgi:hypothetical protein